MMTRAAFCLGLGLLSAGCALVSKDDPTLLRYFSVDAARQREHRVPLVAAGGLPLQLRMGRVTAASYLRDRIAFRSSNVEVGYYDDLRWTEKPEAYVRHDLARALFEDEGVQEIVGGAGPILDVDIDSFEELRDAHAAVVQLRWQLRDDAAVLLRRTVSVRRPLAGAPNAPSSQSALAEALSQALDDAVDQIVKAVVPRLSPSPDTTTNSPTSAGGAPVLAPAGRSGPST